MFLPLNPFEIEAMESGNSLFFEPEAAMRQKVTEERGITSS